MPKPDWRKIEAALIVVAREWGYELKEDTESGDKVTDPAAETINLTELAKELENRL